MKKIKEKKILEFFSKIFGKKKKGRKYNMRPVMEKKRGFELRHVVYIIILIVCLIAIGIAVYMQFF